MEHDIVSDDKITTYPYLQLESRKFFYNKIKEYDSVSDDKITTYPYLQLESRKIFYNKIFNITKYNSY